MKLIKKYKVEAETNNRLVEYLIERSDLDFTKSALKKLFRKGLILLNKSEVNTSTEISENDIIEIFEDSEKGKIPPTNIKLKVLYEDEYLAAVYKEAGILVSGNKHKTIANALSENLKKSDKDDALEKPVPVHRLDFPTSGILLVAKTRQAREMLFKMFEDKLITKEYLAVCPGKMLKEGNINVDIDEKKSFSEFEVLKSVVSEKFTFLNLVLLKPKTGRRHQLRIHLKSIGHPILGDKQYADSNYDIGKGLFLHAFKLNFVHPLYQHEINIEAEIPKKFKKLFP